VEVLEAAGGGCAGGDRVHHGGGVGNAILGRWVMSDPNQSTQRPAPDKTVEELTKINPDEFRHHVLNTPYNDGTYPRTREEWLEEEAKQGGGE